MIAGLFDFIVLVIDFLLGSLIVRFYFDDLVAVLLGSAMCVAAVLEMVIRLA